MRSGRVARPTSFQLFVRSPTKLNQIRAAQPFTSNPRTALPAPTTCSSSHVHLEEVLVTIFNEPAQLGLLTTWVTNHFFRSPNTHKESVEQYGHAPVRRQPTQHTPQDQPYITTSHTHTRTRASSLTCTRALSKSQKLQCVLVKEQSVVKEITDCKTGCRCFYSRKRPAPCTPRTSRCSQKFGQRNSSR